MHLFGLETAEDGVGRMRLGAILVAASATAEGTAEQRPQTPRVEPPSTLSAVNLAAAHVSFLLREDEQTRPPKLTGRAAALARALGALENDERSGDAR